MSEYDLLFDAMGSHVRLLIGEPGAGQPNPEEAGEEVRRFIGEFDRKLSRFRQDSELCGLNADRRERVPASALMREAVRAGIWAAERSGGLVDPTLVGEIEEAGYRESRAGVQGVPLAEALAEAPAREPARPAPNSRWGHIAVNEYDGTITRPPGLRFDTGGTGKGLAADMAAGMLAGFSRFVVDCGGDIRIGGPDAFLRPFDVQVEHPLTGEHAHVLRLSSGGVATSGLNVRVWRRSDGGYAHHLLDPATGRPAWTGLVGATALADTTLEAETLAKAALLSGPEGARRLLGDRGGLLVHETGHVELVGPLSVRPRLRFAPDEERVAA